MAKKTRNEARVFALGKTEHKIRIWRSKEVEAIEEIGEGVGP